MKTLSIIIPVFNEERFIEKAIHSVVNSSTPDFKKEIIIIDDGSTDQTRKVIEKTIHLLKNKKNNISTFKTLFKNKNEGKGSAIKTGLIESTGEIVLIQDADLEYSPDDYGLMIEPFTTSNADVVYGSRFISNRPHRVLYFWHYQINVFLTTLSNMFTNLNLTDMETGYKAFKGDMIRKIAKDLKSKRFGFEPEITARVARVKGVQFYEVGISYFGRTYQEGKKIGWRDGVKAVWEIIRFNLLD